MSLSLDRVAEIAREEDVPVSLALAVYGKESSFGSDPSADIPHDGGVLGPFQLKPETFQGELPGGDINNPEDNARAGIKYLKKAYDASGGNVAEAGYRYYGGPDTKKWGPKTIAYGNDLAAKVQTVGGQSSYASSPPLVDAERAGLTPGSISAAEVQKRSMGADSLPSMSSPDFLSNLISRISSATTDMASASEAQASSLGKIGAQYEAESKTKQDIYGKLGQDDYNVNLAQATKEATQGATAAKIASQAGVNSDDIASVGAQAAIDAREAARQLMGSRDALQAKAAAIPAFLDNPIGWIVGQMAIKGDITEHNNLHNRLTSDLQIISGLTTASDQLERSNTPKLATLTALKSEALAKQSLDLATLHQSEERQKNLLVSQGFVSKDLQAKEATLRALEMQGRFYESLQTAEGARLLKQNKIDQETMMLGTVNTQAEILGSRKFASLSEFNKQPKQIQNAYQEMINSGGNSFGADTLSAMANIRITANPSQMSDSIKQVYSYAQTFQRQTLEEKRGISPGSTEDIMFKNAKPEEQKQEINAEIQKRFHKMQNDTQTSTEDGNANIYHAPAVPDMLKIPAVSRTALGQILQDRLKLSPAVPISDKDVIETVKAQLKSKDGYPGGYEQAAKDLATYFTQAKAANNATYKFEAWKLPPQEKYMIQGKDYSSYKEVIKALTKVSPFEGLGNPGDAFSPALL